MKKRNADFRWYFVRIAVLIIPWARRKTKNPKGTPSKVSYLVKARSLGAAKAKADFLLSVNANTTGSYERDGEKVSILKVGVMDLEQLQERLQDGVEIFEETETDARLEDFRKILVNPRTLRREIKKDDLQGFLPMLPVRWEKEFLNL
jgi:hypothetical protein